MIKLVADGSHTPVRTGPTVRGVCATIFCKHSGELPASIAATTSAKGSAAVLLLRSKMRPAQNASLLVCKNWGGTTRAAAHQPFLI